MNDRGGRAIIAIELLRFACALLVVCYHFGTAMMLFPTPHAKALLAGLTLPRTGVDATWFGWIGVELFFVVSGMVIAQSALGASPTDFVQRRVLRLAPVAWLCASLSAVILATRLPSGWLAIEWLASVSFWPNPEWIDPVYWTLGVEIAFYLLVSWRLRKAGDAATIERLAIALGLWSCAFWVIATVLPMLADWIEVRTVQMLLLPHGCLFALGAMLWAIDARGATPKRVGMAALFALAGVAEIVAHSGGLTRWMHLHHSATAPIAIFLGGVAILANATRLQPIAARFVSARVAAVLGLATYPLYLLHQDVGAVVLSTLLRNGWSYGAAAIFAIGLAVGVALLIAMRVEPVVRRGLSVALSRFHVPARDSRPTASPRAG